MKKKLYQLLSILESFRKDSHYECEDCFYSCPKHEDYCGMGYECDCGLDEINKKVDVAIRIVNNLLTLQIELDKK